MYLSVCIRSRDIPEEGRPDANHGAVQHSGGKPARHPQPGYVQELPQLQVTA